MKVKVEYFSGASYEQYETDVEVGVVYHMSELDDCVIPPEGFMVDYLPEDDFVVNSEL